MGLLRAMQWHESPLPLLQPDQLTQTSISRSSTLNTQVEWLNPQLESWTWTLQPWTSACQHQPLNLQPSTLNHQPSTPKSQLSTLKPQLQLPLTCSQTSNLKHKCFDLCCQSHTLKTSNLQTPTTNQQWPHKHNPQPSTPNPQPSTLNPRLNPQVSTLSPQLQLLSLHPRTSTITFKLPEAPLIPTLQTLITTPLNLPSTPKP